MIWHRVAASLAPPALFLASGLAVAVFPCLPCAFGGEVDCDVPAELVRVDVKLPHLSERLGAGEPVKIVAIGGASTTGAAAGSVDLAYPHRLQETLVRWYPSVPIIVVNKAVPRQ